MRTKIFGYVMFIGLIIFTTACGKQSDQEIVKQMESMTVEEKIGQMMMIGIDGHKMDKRTKSMIEDHHVGGFIVVGRNIKNSDQLKSLLSTLKSTNKENHSIPLFLSVDEEGGRVTRMPRAFINLPSNKRVGEQNNEDLSYQIGSLLAEKVNYFGFNMNYAPVLDINSNPNNPVIGNRSFGNSPELVTKLGIQTMKGLQSKGIIPVVKHFPGHGDTSVDSHTSLPMVNHDLDKLKKMELVPFAEAAKQNADVIMTAHILFPKIDPNNPATLSKTMITDVLRKQLKYNGVVMTDDLTMGAIDENYKMGEAAVKAVLAGNDMILVAHHHEKRKSAIAAILSAVEKGIISEERIDESVYRILKLKKKYNLSDDIEETGTILEINEKVEKLLEQYF